MSIQNTCYMSTNTSTFLPVLCSYSLLSQLAYNARHNTTHASVAWLTAPLDVIGLATELATSHLPVRHASFPRRHTHCTYIYWEPTRSDDLITTSQSRIVDLDMSPSCGSTSRCSLRSLPDKISNLGVYTRAWKGRSIHEHIIHWRFRLGFPVSSLIKPICFVLGVMGKRFSRIAVRVTTISTLEWNLRRRKCSRRCLRHDNVPK